MFTFVKWLTEAELNMFSLSSNLIYLPEDKLEMISILVCEANI